MLTEYFASKFVDYWARIRKDIICWKSSTINWNATKKRLEWYPKSCWTSPFHPQSKFQHCPAFLQLRAHGSSPKPELLASLDLRVETGLDVGQALLLLLESRFDPCYDLKVVKVVGGGCPSLTRLCEHNDLLDVSTLMKMFRRWFPYQSRTKIFWESQLLCSVCQAKHQILFP